MTSGESINPKMWGIAVRVSFRGSNEPTQLSKTFHSGGECAVSTMLVLSSLILEPNISKKNELQVQIYAKKNAKSKVVAICCSSCKQDYLKYNQTNYDSTS